MSFSATGTRRPLQSKPKQNPFLKRSSSSFSNHPRRKPTSNGEPALKRAKTEPSNDDDADRLSSVRIVTSLAPPNTNQDVMSLMHHAQTHMFDDIPERAAGMNSVRIAEVLNFRKNLAPIVSTAHLQALSASSTNTDREVARLVQSGKLRKIAVLGRGKGGAPLGEGLVVAEDWQGLVRESGLDEELKEKYLSLMHEFPNSPSVPASAFTSAEATQLVSAGFMTSTSALASSTEVLSRPGAFSLGTSSSVATAGSSAPTGSIEAAGGRGAIHARGGGGGGLPASSSRSQEAATGTLTFALPSTGTYLRLLTEARSHLLQLLAKSSPRFKEASLDTLRERWDGGIAVDDPASRAKRARGEWVGVLPGKTKKWKTFHGLRYAWVLEECLGSGSLECFDTGSVGLGVRAV